MAIKAVIYDVDGTLVDSEPLHVMAWGEALKRYGHNLRDLSQEFIRTMAGKKPAVIAGEMVASLNMKVEPNVFLETKTKLYLALARSSLKEMKGATKSVKRLKEAGYRLAIGTSLDRELVVSILLRLHIQDDFEVIITGDQIKKGKPDPETYATVMELLKLSPQECIVIEDTQTGVQSAKAAGAWCIAVENVDAVKQDTSRADVVVSSLDMVTQDLIDSISLDFLHL